MMLCARNLTLSGRLGDVSLDLLPGRVTAICGPNGAGKSSLVAAMAGVLPVAGGLRLDGRDMIDMPPRERARLLGYLPQGGEAAWDISVQTLVELGRLPWQAAPMHRAHADRAQDREAVAEAIAAMDLEHLIERPLSRLSGGERARALLARVLAGRPRWVLADEPLASLDLGHGLRLLAALRQQAEQGVGVCLVLHDLAMAMNHADRVVVMEAGRVVADGPPGEALSEAVIARVWGVNASWLGPEGVRALSL
ncbi:ABC transporter ATP-binding protein [Novosphingobium sp. KACC 22771]|uniref:ABC transporter ATP-binding protein n=1 Tax=Novosphingobium sp. KACC 22771 TaxID=3025670 RepID=UPI002365516A|nr:ABC transporter ATP-binding protein [Novosphingobium sp. KACC 22771]WDF71023.1 ABC transporter ATP-binding protein [Novosphingobium sp. KACC 22771]